jgi:hypothetical protein
LEKEKTTSSFQVEDMPEGLRVVVRPQHSVVGAVFALGGAAAALILAPTLLKAALSEPAFPMQKPIYLALFVSWTAAGTIGILKVAWSVLAAEVLSASPQGFSTGWQILGLGTLKHIPVSGLREFRPVLEHDIRTAKGSVLLGSEAGPVFFGKGLPLEDAREIVSQVRARFGIRA